ncbi:MAG: 50S ribosomal protein L16 [Bacteroidota bacterium]
MLQPKRTKFRKMQKGKVKGLATRGHQIAFGSFALKALEPAWITARQLEAARVALTRAMKREGQVWIRIFPDKPITRKPAEVRMGKGTGAPEYWVAVVKPGTILFEAGGVTMATAKEALSLADGKLPLKTKFTVRRDYVEQVEK